MPTPASPRCNRVTPFGQLEATPERGRFMGNRSILTAGRSGRMRAWTTQAWVCCRTDFRGRRVTFDSPRHYTPLFFADEAVALAAGHRPCAECRNADYKAFKAAFRLARGLAEEAPLSAAQVDRALHDARIRDGRKRTYVAVLGDLPAGAFLLRPTAPDQALLLTEGGLRRWAHGGYGPLENADPEETETVTVLTPAPTVAVLKAGYRLQNLSEDRRGVG